MLNKKQSLHLATIKDIPILVHWTFGLFIAFILYTAWENNFSPADSFWYVMFVFILFFFVIMHEFGHALVARRYGILTKDIIISPIGGIARLMDIPRKPTQELIVAIAGPAVNVGLAFFFFLMLLPFTSNFFPENPNMNLISAPIDYLRYLLLINVTLVVFNMIPAFPMDGGRVFRALLAYWMPRLKATYIAMIVARIFAVIFIGLGLYTSHYVLALIGGFILFTSGQEYGQVRADDIFENKTAKAALITNPLFLNLNDTFSKIISLPFKDQGSYPVNDNYGNPIGVITRPAIKYVKKNKLTTDSIASYISNSHGAINEDLKLRSVFSLMEQNGWYTATIYSKNLEDLGIIDRVSLENVIQPRRKKKEKRRVVKSLI
ncbi:MAG: site-2 protease family protein [Saprospiraceae bacterium]